MSPQDLFSMAKKNLLARKLRTFLTLLGVMIGTTAIIVTMSFGFGMKEQNENLIKSMGDLTAFDVFPDMEMETDGPAKKMTDITVEEFKKIPHVVSVSPVYQDSFSVTYKKYENPSLQITALDPEALESYGWEFEDGKMFKDKGNIEMIFGSKVLESFYNPKKPMEASFDEEGNYIQPPDPFRATGATMEVSKTDMEGMGMGPMMPSLPGQKMDDPNSNKKEGVKVVGKLKEKKDFTVDYTAFMSINSYKALLKKLNQPLPAKNDYSTLKVKVDDIQNAREVEKELKNMGYQARGLFSMLDSMKQSMAIISAIFVGIGAISFIVAAIGITNTMIMSIYERTREIGVMKVIGASIRDIQRLFLVEAGMIGFMGGLIGVSFSLLLSLMFNTLFNQFAQQNGMEEAVKISIIPFWIILLAIAFSTLVGVLAGYFPAKRAMNLSALEAIRTE